MFKRRSWRSVSRSGAAVALGSSGCACVVALSPVGNGVYNARGSVASAEVYMKALVLSLRLAAAAAVLLPVAYATPLVAQETLTADQIVERALDTNTIGFQSGEVTMTLTITDAAGDVRERSLHIRGVDEGGLGRARVEVTAPAAQAGQTYLFRENATGEDDVYVFLPALDDAPRRISGSQKNGAFLGSHFTIADLESRDIRDARYTQQADESIGTFPCYVIDAAPNDPSDTDYASVRLWIRKSDFIPIRVRFFDAAGATLKTIFTEETAEREGGGTYVRRLTLRPAEGGSTTMAIGTVDFNAQVGTAEMTPQALAQ
jgi:hypothetical protein